MTRLFVQRFPIYLKRVNGELVEYQTIPDTLRHPLTYDSKYPYEIHTAKGGYGITIRSRLPTQDLLVPHDLDQLDFIPKIEDKTSALLSGRRSGILKSKGNLYRLKAIRSGTNPVISIPFNGTQQLHSSDREYEQSESFNRFLQENGITPVMRILGFYRFGDLSTTISKVTGDTRLDELFYIIEAVYSEFIKDSENEVIFNKLAKQIYFDLGLATGRLKSIMNNHGITWSYNTERTNAHIGNVVIYQTDNGEIKIGFVDFDASSDKTEKSQTEIDDQHANEYLTLNESVFQLGIFSSENQYGKSYVPIGPNRVEKMEDYRRSFSHGMSIASYVPQEEIDKIDLGKLEELFSMFPESTQRKIEPMAFKDFGNIWFRIDENNVLGSLSQMTDIIFDANEIPEERRSRAQELIVDEVGE